MLRKKSTRVKHHYKAIIIDIFSLSLSLSHTISACVCLCVSCVRFRIKCVCLRACLCTECLCVCVCVCVFYVYVCALNVHVCVKSSCEKFATNLPIVCWSMLANTHTHTCVKNPLGCCFICK
jgi:hypothetical protein